MRFIDTNVFLRLLTRDHPQNSEACLKMFRKALEKGEPLFSSDLVMAEIIWVLEGFYHLKKGEIVNKMEKILNTPNLHCQNKKLLQECLILYLEKDIDFAVLFYLAEHGSKDIFGMDSLREMEVRNPNGVNYALKVLMEKEILEKGKKGEYRFVDPFFAFYLRKKGRGGGLR